MRMERYALATLAARGIACLACTAGTVTIDSVHTPRPIVLAGSIAIDRIMNFSGSYADHLHAEKLSNVSVSIFLDSMIDAPGGVAANIAHTLALLGEEPYLLGAVGLDATTYMEQLARRGVNITHIHESQLPTASFNVITDSQQNQVGGFYPGAMFDSDTLRLTPWYTKDPVVVVSPHDPKAMRRQVAECRTHQLTLCYDIGQQVSNAPAEDLAEGIAAATILIVNEYELSILAKKTGQSEDTICSSVPIVITTLGPEGSRLRGKDVADSCVIGVAQPTQVVDPTGAGDAYRAGFLYGYARDWPLKTCMQLGATTASFALEGTGTQSHTCTPAEIAARYQATFNEALPSNPRTKAFFTTYPRVEPEC